MFIGAENLGTGTVLGAAVLKQEAPARLPRVAAFSKAMNATPTNSSDASCMVSSLLWRNRGLLMVAFSAVSFSVMSLFAELSTMSGVPSMMIVASRGICMSVSSLVAIIWRKTPLSTPGAYPFLSLRAILGTISISSFFYSLEGLELADASAIMFSKPAFTTLVARVVLGEQFNWVDGIVLCLSLLGTLVISRPPMIFGNGLSSPPLIFVGLALMGCMCSSVSYIVVRKIRKVPFFIIVFYFGVVSSIVALVHIGFIDFKSLPSISSRLIVYLAVSGISGCLGQMLLMRGLQLEKAGHASVMRNLDLPCAFLWQTVILRDTPDVWSSTGALLIFASAMLLLWNKAVHLAEDDSHKDQENRSNIEEVALISFVTEFAGEDKHLIVQTANDLDEDRYLA